MTLPWRPPSGRHSFRAPQFRASRTRVAQQLLLTGLDYMFGQHAERTCSLSLLKRVLHQAVFPRVVTQHHPAAARIPPSLDSPRSAAPETFLLRDAVSAFPIAFGPLPQSLPSARYPVSVALSRSPWRSCWNRAHPLPGRAGRRFLFPTSDSQFHLPSVRRWQCPSACPALRPREMKIPARPDQAACSKLPSRPRPRPPAESPTLARPPQSSRTATAPASPSLRSSSAAPAPVPTPVRPGPD